MARPESAPPPPAAGDVPGPPDLVDRRALDALVSATYEELRRLAARVARDEPGATLSPTALVHEAWLKLAGAPPFAATSRLHFKRVAARAMRQVLVEAARRRRAGKRGGGAAAVTLDPALGGPPNGVPAGSPDAWAGHAADDGELLALDDALGELARLSPRQALLVESRFFGGLEVAEAAELLGVSEATALRDWRAARAWLARALGAARGA